MIKCEHCGSMNVETKAWINCNTEEVIEWCTDDKYFCGECHDFVVIIETE